MKGERGRVEWHGGFCTLGIVAPRLPEGGPRGPRGRCEPAQDGDCEMAGRPPTGWAVCLSGSLAVSLSLSLFCVCVCVSVLGLNDQDHTQARFGRSRLVMLRHPSDQHETWTPMQRDRRLPSR